MNTQLIQPNFNVTGRIGYCEEFVEAVFGQPELTDCAWDAWLATPVKHYDRNFPPDVTVILYFSYTATINGVTRNWGHISAHAPNGTIYSSPWKQGTVRAELTSVSEVEQFYTTHEDGGTQQVAYVGWSEYLANVKVAELQEVEPMSPQDITNIVNAMVGQQADADDLALSAQGWHDAIYALFAKYGPAIHQAEQQGVAIAGDYTNLANALGMSSTPDQAAAAAAQGWHDMVYGLFGRTDFPKLGANAPEAKPTKPSTLNVVINGQTYVPQSTSGSAAAA